MFGLSNQLEAEAIQTIEEMILEGTEQKKIGGTPFYLSTKKNQKDILLGKITKGKIYYLYQKNPLNY